MNRISRLGTRCMGLLVLAATSAWAQQEEALWLDTRSGAAIPSKLTLQKGRPYRVTMQGTFNVWGNNIVAGEKSGQPEAAPMFPSPNVANRNVGFDPEFVFAGVRAPATAPLRSGAIQVSVDGGKTWKHPATPAAFNAAEHKYTYDLMGEDAPLQVRFVDTPISDNSGRVRILLLPTAWRQCRSLRRAGRVGDWQPTFCSTRSAEKRKHPVPPCRRPLGSSTKSAECPRRRRSPPPRSPWAQRSPPPRSACPRHTTMMPGGSRLPRRKVTWRRCGPCLPGEFRSTARNPRRGPRHCTTLR